MSEERTGLGQRAKSLLEQTKRAVGAGDPPLATQVGGRIEAMRDALRAFGDGEIDRFLSAFADDVEWVAPKGDKFPGAGTHHGQSAVREQFVDAVERSYASFGFEPQRYLESEGENFVVAFGSFSGEGLKGTGRLEAPGVQLWEFDGDKVTRVEIFTDTAAFPGVLSEDERAEHDKQAEEGEDEGEERESGAEGEKGEATAEGKASGEDEGEDEGEERGSGAEGEKGEAKAEAKAGGEREDKESDH